VKAFVAGLVVAAVLDLPPMERAGVIVAGGLIGVLVWFVDRARRQARWPDGKP
jgi:hypothetical protein